jgi:hypothetical protein
MARMAELGAYGARATSGEPNVDHHWQLIGDIEQSALRAIRGHMLGQAVLGARCTPTTLD